MHTPQGLQEQLISASTLYRPVSSSSALTDGPAVTKGDNNPTDDISLYNGLKYLKRSNMFAAVAEALFRQA